MSADAETIARLMRTGDTFEKLAASCGMSTEDFRRQWLEGERRARAELASCRNHPNRMNVAQFPDRLCPECLVAAENAGARQADREWSQTKGHEDNRTVRRGIYGPESLPKRGQ